VTADAWCADADSQSAMASRLSTDTLDSEGQVRVTVHTMFLQQIGNSVVT